MNQSEYRETLSLAREEGEHGVIDLPESCEGLIRIRIENAYLSGVLRGLDIAKKGNTDESYPDDYSDEFYADRVHGTGV